MLLVIIGWLVDWLVGNAVFPETALKIFLIFCMKLGYYKGRKVTAGFEKKHLIWRYSPKDLQISVGWFVGWLVSNAVFSETALRIFLFFCLKLGDYKGRKVTCWSFEKNSWFSDIREKVSKLAQSQTLFSKTVLTTFLVFGLKLVLNTTFNLNETYFSEKFAIWRYLTAKSSKNCPNWGF